MEIKISTKAILNILYVLSWIIFLSLCVQAGSFICNAVFTVTLYPDGVNYFGLAGLYAYDPGHFLVILLLMSIVAALKAFIFYLVVKILHDKKLDMVQPFNKDMGRFIFNIAYLALGTAFFSNWGVDYAGWLVEQGVKMPETRHLDLGGADVWLFMGVTLFVIGQIFKRGIEIQSDNELTI